MRDAIFPGSIRNLFLPPKGLASLAPSVRPASPLSRPLQTFDLDRRMRMRMQKANAILYVM